MRVLAVTSLCVFNVKLTSTGRFTDLIGFRRIPIRSTGTAQLKDSTVSIESASKRYRHRVFYFDKLHYYFSELVPSSALEVAHYPLNLP